MAKNKLHIEPSDVKVATCSDGWGGFDYSCLVERINTEKLWGDCFSIADTLEENHRIFVEVDDFDYLGCLHLTIHPRGQEFTDEELATWIADEINAIS